MPSFHRSRIYLCFFCGVLMPLSLISQENFHGIVAGTVTGKTETSVTVKVSKVIEIASINKMQNTESLIGTEITAPLTANPYWKTKAEESLKKIQTGMYVTARLEWNGGMNALTLLSADQRAAERQITRGDIVSTRYTAKQNGTPLDVYDFWEGGGGPSADNKNKIIAKNYIVQFEWDESSIVAISSPEGITNAALLTDAPSHAMKFDAGVIRLRFTAPGEACIKLNDDSRQLLYVFAVAKSKDPGEANVTRYFKAGIHMAGTITVNKDDTSIYLAPGAIVFGGITGNAASRISIRGTGMLVYHTNVQGRFTAIDDFVIDGPTIINPYDNWTLHPIFCSNVTFRNFRMCTRSRDGLDIGGCTNMLVENGFISAFDDCICLKASPRVGRPRNAFITVRNMVLAHTGGGNLIDTGHEGQTDLWHDITFSNIHGIMCHFPPNEIAKLPEYNRNYPTAAISLHVVDDVCISNIVFRDIRIDHNLKPFHFDLRVFENTHLYKAYKYPEGYKPTGSIVNILFENIDIRSTDTRPSYIGGYSGQAGIRGITFSNLTIAGKKILKAEDAGFQIMEHVENVLFR